MERCLQIPEVLNSICEELNPPDALSVALTSRAFLEPGLDSVWYEIKSFDPLISCLPDDLWLAKQVTSHQPGMGRMSTATVLDIVAGAATGDRPPTWGFSPCLKECTIYWISFQGIQQMMGNYKEDVAPYMSLFFGCSVESLLLSLEEVPDESEDPLLAASVALMGRRFPHVKDLVFEAPSLGWSLEVAHDFFASSSWSYLQELSLQYATPRLVRQLATFPCLSSLYIYDNQRQRHPDWDTPLPPYTPLGEDGFPALRELELTLDKITDAIHFLRLMSPNNKLKELQCNAYAKGCTSEECQTVIDAIRDHCNPLTLESVSLCAPEEYFNDPQAIEQIDLASEDLVDLSPLYRFSKLRSLEIQFEGSVQFAEAQIPEISRAWPDLDNLELCTRFSNPDRIPSMNHHGLLRLLQACPKIDSLGLRIDTTQLNSKEEVSNAGTFPLKYLCFGDSPICSPSLVVAFLRTHFPDLPSLETTYIKRANEAQETLLDRRWKMVKETLKEVPALRN